METIALKEIHPYVRHARTFSIQNGATRFINVAAYDYRLLFVAKGSGKIIIGEKPYSVENGNIFIFPPGTPYSYFPEKGVPLTLIAISFDLSFLNISKANIPLPPAKVNEYKNDSILMPIRVKDCPDMNDVIFVHDGFRFEKTLTDIIYEYENKLNFYNEKMSGMFLSVIMDIIRKTGPDIQSSEDKSIKNILKIIRENYSLKLTNSAIGKMLGYHPNHVNRLMIKHTGCSLHDYLINYRITQSINLLTTTNLTVTEIAENVGFGGVTHFSACFKQKTGHTPSAYRKGI